MNLNYCEWTNTLYNEFIFFLKDQADLKYKEFHSKLVPNYDSDKIIGIRIPVLRKIAKDISKGNAKSFLEVMKTDYYEEAMLRGIIIGLIKTESYEEFKDLIDSQIKYIDNWALCDCFCSGLKQAQKYKYQLFNSVKEYLKSENPWKIRVGLIILLSFYLDEEYIQSSLNLADSVHSQHYYVSMAQAWLTATAFAKNEQLTMKFFKKCSFDNKTFNRTIQKTRESYRVSKELKETLKNMKRTVDKNR